VSGLRMTSFSAITPQRERDNPDALSAARATCA